MTRNKLTYEESHKEINGVLYKLCNRCSKWFICSEEYFYKNNKNLSDGLHPYCKECTKSKSLEWIKNNYEHSLKQQREYKQRSPIKERQKDYIKQWHEDNIEHKQKYQLEWQQNNKDKLARYGEGRCNKNHNITTEEWSYCIDYFGDSCAYCGISEQDAKEQQGQYLHKEHVNHNGNNDLSNCVPSCRSCNCKKWMFEFEEWYNKENPIFDENRLHKITQWLNEDYKTIKSNK